MLFVFVFVFVFVLLGAAAFFLIRKKEMHIWLPHYIARKLKGKPDYCGPLHIMFCFTDHYEPQWGNPGDIDIERSRVDRWLVEYPKLFGDIKDADGCSPKHRHKSPITSTILVLTKRKCSSRRFVLRLFVWSISTQLHVYLCKVKKCEMYTTRKRKQLV